MNPSDILKLSQTDGHAKIACQILTKDFNMSMSQIFGGEIKFEYGPDLVLGALERCQEEYESFQKIIHWQPVSLKVEFKEFKNTTHFYENWIQFPYYNPKNWKTFFDKSFNDPKDSKKFIDEHKPVIEKVYSGWKFGNKDL